MTVKNGVKNISKEKAEATKLFEQNGVFENSCKYDLIACNLSKSKNNGTFSGSDPGPW